MSEIILPKIASKKPYKFTVKKGETYSWCSCGLSKKDPFCDGSHKQCLKSDGTAIMKSVKYTAEEDKVVFFCGCKHSKNGIFCDGSHTKL